MTPPSPALSTVYRPRQAVEVQATLMPLRRGPHDPTLRWEGQGVWRAFRAPTGPATLHLAPRGAEIDAQAWGPGAEWAIAQVPALLGAHDDWSGLDAARHPFVVSARRRMRGLRLARTGLVLDALIPAVLEQRVTIIEAYRSFQHLVLRHGDDAPGPAPAGMRVPPAAETLRAIPSWQWHRAGVDPRRSAVAVRAAGRAAALERTTRMPEAERARSALMSIPGVGPWTAAETAQRAFGDPDAISLGDYGLPALVGHTLAGAEVDEAGMLELLEPWAGHRQRVVRLILACGTRPPRRAPRAAIPDHRFR